MTKISDIISDLKSAGLTVEARIGTAQTIDEVTFDSRKAKERTLFVAQRGEKVDGHKFIAQAIAQGCRAVLCEELPADAVMPEDGSVIIVDSTHKALGLAAATHFGHPSRHLKLVGVTGTNGKTSTATLLHHLMMRRGVKAGLLSTVANFIGEKEFAATHTTPDAVSIQSLMRQMVDEGCEYCFMEVSSHSLVQHRVVGLDFEVAIFTNLTHDHLDYHKTFENYRDAKKMLFDGLRANATAVVNIDDKNGLYMVQNTKAKVRTYSLQRPADIKGKIEEMTFEGMQLNINNMDVYMPFVGRFNAYNLMGIYGAAVALGIDGAEVLQHLSALKAVNGRFEVIRSADGRTAIVDYAHTPDALTNVISTINEVRKQNKDAQLISVMGCGGDRDRTKRPEMAHEAARLSDRVILTSDNPRTEDPAAIIEEMKTGLTADDAQHTLSIVDRREAIRTALTIARSGDIVLIAGKGHENYQEINGVKHHFDDHEVVREAFNL